MGNIPASWWLSPAWDLTLNIGVISTPYSSWACLLLCAMMKLCWLAFKLLLQSHPETLPPSVCLQTVAHSHLLDQGQREIGSRERQVSVAPLWQNHSAKALRCACGTGGADACCSSGLSQQANTWEGRTFWWIWSTWGCKASLNNFENRERWKTGTGSKKCTQFLSSLLSLQYHLVEVDVLRCGLNRQGDCNPKGFCGTRKDRKFWKNT